MTEPKWERVLHDTSRLPVPGGWIYSRTIPDGGGLCFVPTLTEQAILDALDAAHVALRKVDASDTTQPQTEDTLDAVLAARLLIDRVAYAAGHILPERRK